MRPARSGDRFDRMGRHRQDPRVVAAIALVLAAVAIALELAYTIGHFVFTTVDQIRPS